jgi:hypothetical protein
MAVPYVFMIGYEANGEPSVHLDAETYASDNSGGAMWNIFAMAEHLNSRPTEIILPWMNGRRLRKLADNKWIVEGIEDVEF